MLTLDIQKDIHSLHFHNERSSGGSGDLVGLWMPLFEHPICMFVQTQTILDRIQILFDWKSFRFPQEVLQDVAREIACFAWSF